MKIKEIKLKINTKNAETPRSPWKKGGGSCAKKEPSRQKKEARSLSAVTSGVTTPKSFLLLVEVIGNK